MFKLAKPTRKWLTVWGALVGGLVFACALSAHSLLEFGALSLVVILQGLLLLLLVSYMVPAVRQMSEDVRALIAYVKSWKTRSSDYKSQVYKTAALAGLLFTTMAAMLWLVWPIAGAVVQHLSPGETDPFMTMIAGFFMVFIPYNILIFVVLFAVAFLRRKRAR